MCDWNIEAIDHNSNLFRFLHIDIITNNLNFDLIELFWTKLLEDGLSSNWNKYANLDLSFILLGISKKHGKPNEYKDYSKFKFFKINVELILNFNSEITVSHSPSQYTEIKNRSHTLIKYPQFNDKSDKLEYVSNLAAYILENNNVKPNLFEPYLVHNGNIESEISRLRLLENDNPYRFCKAFE